MSAAVSSGRTLPPPTVALRWAAVAGAAAFAAGAVWRPAEAWPNLLVTLFLVLGFGLAGALLIAIHDAMGATWAESIRRIPEAMAETLPPLSGLAVLLLLGARVLYPWARPEIMAADPILMLKRGWLNLPFFSVRTVLYVSLWSGFAHAMVRNSRSAHPDRAARAVRRAVAFLIVFGATFPLASMDWIMSLEPHWASTIFGIYTFAGIFQSGLALIILLLLELRRRGLWREELEAELLHDIGKLFFAFSCFWVYMWFSQYMLIWYANLPDEISYYLARSGRWFDLMMVLVVVNFAVPFFGLASQTAKRNPGILAWVSAIVLLGHWADLYWMILPPFQGGTPRIGILEIVLPLGGAAAFLLLVLRGNPAPSPAPASVANSSHPRPSRER